MRADGRILLMQVAKGNCCRILPNVLGTDYARAPAAKPVNARYGEDRRVSSGRLLVGSR